MQRKSNLLIVASHLWIGGAESVIQHLAEFIDRDRFNVTVCCLKHRGSVGDELARKGIDIISFAEPGDMRVDYLTFVKLFKVIRARKIDVVHTHTTHGLFDSSLCSLLLPRLKVVHTFHFGNYPHTKPRILWMERICSRFADRLYAVGEVQRKQIQTVYGLSDRQIGTVYNGVSFRTGLGDPEFRRKIGADNRVLIGTIATLITQKGLTYLLDVAKAIKESGRKVVFVVVGEGQLRSELEAKRDRLGLHDTVAFAGWVKNAAEVALPAFDVFFQPSLWEAMSMVILEAMSSGKPVVATRVGENGRIIEDGVDGLLVEPTDVAGMASALGRVIDDASLRISLGQAARDKVGERFTIHHMVRDYEAVYEDVLR
jgi:glycosyltransferase involved in cell wall biosynthesis